MALGVAAAVLLVAAEIADISSISIGAAECVDRARGTDRDICTSSGGEQHSYALVVLALFALVMAWGATVGGSRPAAAALVAVGVVVLAIALIGDVPATDDTRGLEVRYSDVKAKAEIGLKLELAGGVLAILAGGLALLSARSAPPDE